MAAVNGARSEVGVSAAWRELEEGHPRFDIKHLGVSRQEGVGADDGPTDSHPHVYT